MSINHESFKQMRPEKQRKLISLNRTARYNGMATQKLSEYYLKFIKPKEGKADEGVDGNRHQ